MKLKKMTEKHGILISIILGFIILLVMKVQFIKETNSIEFIGRANGIIDIVLAIVISIVLYYNLKIKDKRLWTISICVGILFGICYYLGEFQNAYIRTIAPTSLKFIAYSMMKIIIYSILFTNFVFFVFNKLPKIASKFNTNKNYKYFTNNKKSLIIIALIFFMSYLPFFLYYFPGNVNTDSVGSLYQVTGISKYSNFQPILYTLLLGGLWNLGKVIFGSSIAGIAVYTIFQMICTSIVFSLILYYMAKRKIDLKWRIITFLFLILNPMNGWFVVRCEKGMLFHLAVVLVVLGIIDIIYEKEKFFEKKWKAICLAFITVVMIFIRNNGLYAILLTLPFLLFTCKKFWKPIITTFGTVLIVTVIIQGPVFNMLNISYSSPGEVLSIPIQQFARIGKYNSDRLSEEDKKNVEKYFTVNYEQLSDDYIPWISDATKSKLSVEEFNKDKMGFIMQYFKFAIKYPMQTVSAFVLNNGANYSPNFNVWGYVRIYGTETQDSYETLSAGGKEEIDHFIKDNSLHGNPIVEFKFLDDINEEIRKGTIPIISNLFDNIGLYFWMLVLCLAYCIYIKQFKNIVMLLPILGLWLTTIAAPVVDIRYIYSMFLTIPIFMGIIIKDSKNRT